MTAGTWSTTFRSVDTSCNGDALVEAGLGFAWGFDGIDRDVHFDELPKGVALVGGVGVLLGTCHELCSVRY